MALIFLAARLYLQYPPGSGSVRSFYLLFLLVLVLKLPLQPKSQSEQLNQNHSCFTHSGILYIACRHRDCRLLVWLTSFTAATDTLLLGHILPETTAAVSLTSINVAGTPVNKEKSLMLKEIAGLITSHRMPPGPWYHYWQLEDRQFLLADSGIKALAKLSPTSGNHIIALSSLTKLPLSTCWITELLVFLLASCDCVNGPLFGQAHAIRPLGACH